MTAGSRQSLMDELLRGGIPEIKLGLGETIDRENARPLPPRYARLLPETLLVVTLRPDAADALEPIAADLERELTDSCTRHGSLYDRTYRVRLQRSGDHDAPLYVISTHAGKDIGASGASGASARPGEDRGGVPVPDRISVVDPQSRAGAAAADGDAREASAARPPATGPSPARSGTAETAYTAWTLPVSDADVTRTPDRPDVDWHSGRWVLVVESTDGAESEVFRLSEPLVTVGRRTDDPGLRATIAISDAPNVSRRQLALEWEDRDGAAGFRVFNLGLNTIHVPGRDIPGSRAGKAMTDLGRIEEKFTGWVPPGVPMRIGDHGPTLRIEEVPPADDEDGDSDATVYE